MRPAGSIDSCAARSSALMSASAIWAPPIATSTLATSLTTPPAE
jgi:hypothetical protein